MNNFFLKKIDLELYKHKLLNDYITKALEGFAPLNESSVINTSSDGWILILHGDILLVYGENWSEYQIQELSEVFDLNRYTNYHVTGDDELIRKLTEFYKPKNLEIEKRRTFYHTDRTSNFTLGDLKIKNGSLNISNELATMLQQYYKEEYNGFNDKTIEEMRQRIDMHINNNKIYVLSDANDNILSFCTIIDPEIGIMFTKREHRNKGYGKIILSHCSQLLQEKNGVVYVMTDRDKPESNLVCEAVGFSPYYNYISIRINCT